MHTTTTDRLEAEAERTAGILEDRHDAASMHRDATTTATQARALANKIIATSQHDSTAHWLMVAKSLTLMPEMMDSFAVEHGLPRPTDAVKVTCIAYVRSQGLAASLSPIPPASERPVCVTVGWLADNPGHAAQLEYHDHNDDPCWRPAAHAVDTIDDGWCVEVRQRMHVVGA